jgi:nitrogen regulatory protein P-II 1
MRRVEALLPPAKLDEVRETLADLGVHALTLTEVKIVDPASRRRNVYRGSTYVVDFAFRIKMELVARDGLVPAILAALRRALTGAGAGESTVLVSEVVEIVRIGTVEAPGLPLASARP